MEDDPAVGTMGQCSLCGKDGLIAQVIPVYTALRTATRQKTGFKEYTTTVTTTGFKEHQRKVCEDCVAAAQSARRSLTIAALAFLAVVIPLSIASGVAWGWMVLLFFTVTGLAGRYDETYIDLAHKAKRVSVGARPNFFDTSADVGGRVGFTDAEYKSFVKQHGRR